MDTEIQKSKSDGPPFQTAPISSPMIHPKPSYQHQIINNEMSQRASVQVNEFSVGSQKTTQQQAANMNYQQQNLASIDQYNSSPQIPQTYGLKSQVPIQEIKKNILTQSPIAQNLTSAHDHLVFEIVTNSDEIQIQREDIFKQTSFIVNQTIDIRDDYFSGNIQLSGKKESDRFTSAERMKDNERIIQNLPSQSNFMLNHQQYEELSTESTNQFGQLAFGQSATLSQNLLTGPYYDTDNTLESSRTFRKGKQQEKPSQKFNRIVSEMELVKVEEEESKSSSESHQNHNHDKGVCISVAKSHQNHQQALSPAQVTKNINIIAQNESNGERNSKNTIETNLQSRIMSSNQIDKGKISVLSRSGSAVGGTLSSQSKIITKTMKDDFEFQGLLGEGTYGKVFLAKHFFTAKFYAIKVIEKRKVLQLQKQPEVFKERKALIMLDHPNIVKMHWSFDDKKYLYFVLDLAPNGELYQVLKREKKLKYDQAQFIAAELVLILEYMHGKGRLHIKLVDFGTAKFINEGEKGGMPGRFNVEDGGTPLQTQMQTDATDKSDFTTAMTGASQLTTTPRRKGTLVGSEDYIAPEIIQGEPSGAPADLWSLGVILYLLLSGDSPFKGHTELITFQNILNIAYQFKEDEPNFSAQAKDLISKLLVKDPHERLANFTDSSNPQPGCYPQLRDHPYFDGIDFTDVLTMETPLDKKKFERQLLKEKILQDQSNVKDMVEQMEEQKEEPVAQKKNRERPRSVLIPTSNAQDFILNKTNLRQTDVEESKTPIVEFSQKSQKKLSMIILESILKKKNRFGLYFRKKLTLTSDFNLYYSDKKESTKEPKYISLRHDRIQIERITNNKFKIIARELQKTTTKGRQVNQFKEKTRTFKCCDKNECDTWISKILEAINQFSIVMSSMSNTGANQRTTADFSSAVARHSISFANPMQRNQTSDNLLIASDYDSPARGYSPQVHSKSNDLNANQSPSNKSSHQAFQGFTLHQVRTTQTIDTANQNMHDDINKQRKFN